MARPHRLTLEEIQLAFEQPEVRAQFPLILSPEQFARLFGVSVSTVYCWITKGRLDGAVARIGKHRRIWRNRAIEIVFNRGKCKDATHTTMKNGVNIHESPGT